MLSGSELETPIEVFVLFFLLLPRLILTNGIWKKKILASDI